MESKGDPPPWLPRTLNPLSSTIFPEITEPARRRKLVLFHFTATCKITRQDPPRRLVEFLHPFLHAFFAHRKNDAWILGITGEVQDEPFHGAAEFRFDEVGIYLELAQVFFHKGTVHRRFLPCLEVYDPHLIPIPERRSMVPFRM